MENKQSGKKTKQITTEWYMILKQKGYLRDTFDSCLDKQFGVIGKRLLKILKGHKHILQSSVPKDHRLCWVKIQLVLPRALAGLGLSILIAEDNPFAINPKTLYKR